MIPTTTTTTTTTTPQAQDEDTAVDDNNISTTNNTANNEDDDDDDNEQEEEEHIIITTGQQNAPPPSSDNDVHHPSSSELLLLTNNVVDANDALIMPPMSSPTTTTPPDTPTLTGFPFCTPNTPHTPFSPVVVNNHNRFEIEAATGDGQYHQMTKTTTTTTATAHHTRTNSSMKASIDAAYNTLTHHADDNNTRVAALYDKKTTIIVQSEAEQITIQEEGYDGATDFDTMSTATATDATTVDLSTSTTTTAYSIQVTPDKKLLKPHRGKKGKSRRTKSELKREEENAVINHDDKLRIQSFKQDDLSSSLSYNPAKLKIPVTYSSFRNVIGGSKEEAFLSDDENEEEAQIPEEKKDEKKEVEEKQQVVYVNDEAANKKTRRRMPSNYIRTTKYTFLTFLPFNLFEQFKKISNIYFLITMIITLIPGISPVFPASSIMPLFFILTLTAIKDGFEDLARFREDLRANGVMVNVVKDGEFKLMKTSSIKIGDVVYVKRDEAFPADLICLSSNRDDGACYVQTANLDGESNLKPKFSLRDTAHIREDNKLMSSIRAKMKVELPNARLDKFDGSFRLKMLDGNKVKRRRVPLDVDNILMRGSVLKNTKFIYGAVVYVGQDTRLFKNLKKPKARLSLLDKRLNMLLCSLIILQQVICGIYVIFSTRFQNMTARTSFYLNRIFSGYANFEYVVRDWMTYFILLNLVIPMSLFVGLEFVKAFQAKLMEADNEMKMVDDNGNIVSMIAKTSNLNQELSQIDVIFSDKTGTLTENVMEYKQCWVNGTYFGDDKGILAWMLKHPKVKPSNNRKDPIAYHMYMIHEFLLGLVLNNAIIPETADDGTIIFEGPSPDEIALLTCAKNNGYMLVQRNTHGLEVHINGVKYFYDVLATLAFTSDRKRMSVITRSPEGKIVIYSKGADNIMFERSNVSHEDRSDMERALDVFAQSGLRTLVICRKELTQQEYDDWFRQYHKATLSTQKNKDELIEEISSCIEQNFEVLGATAIEDKLQQGVPDAIEFLRKAGFQIWVLTGDKPETARNIAYTANVIQKNTIEIRVQESESRRHCKKKLMIAWTFLEEHKKKNVDYALLIDAKSLFYILGNKKIEKKLLEIIRYCKTAVCCRLTALQKAQIVQLIERSCNKKGLSIGDGVNDVSMIQAATVGVGILGREGSQAARASDYAIPRFRHLVRLLAVHGRYSYIRNSDYLHLSFYKNMIIVYSQLIFSIFTGFTGQTLFESWILSLYNTIFTFLPPMISGIFEKDIPEDIILANPELYKANRNDALFNKKTLLFWFLTPLIHSLIIFFGTYAMSETSVLGNTQDDLWSHGTICLTTAITVIMIRHSMELKNWTIITHAVMWASWLSYILFIVFYNLIPDLGILGKTKYYWVAFEFFKSPKPFLISMLLTAVCTVPDFSLKFIKRYTFPSEWEAALLRTSQERRKNAKRAKKLKKENKVKDIEMKSNAFQVAVNT